MHYADNLTLKGIADHITVAGESPREWVPYRIHTQANMCHTNIGNPTRPSAITPLEAERYLPRIRRTCVHVTCDMQPIREKTLSKGFLLMRRSHRESSHFTMPCVITNKEFTTISTSN